MYIQFLILAKKIFSKIAKFVPFIKADSIIFHFLKKNFSGIAKQYAAEAASPKTDQNPERIWVFWYQGYEDAPPLVKKCIDSVYKHAGKRQVILLTKESISEYIRLPDFIMKKVKKGCISLTHFSDILRMELIAAYGGLWLDATIFVSSTIPDDFFSSDYYTIHYSTSTSAITGGRWTGFCQSGRADSVVHRFCRDVFRAYWKKYDILIDYFLIDYVTSFGCKTVPAIASLIDAVPLNNEGIKELDRHFNDEYSEAHLKSILSSSAFFKLNWKRSYTAEINGRKTVYGHFISEQ